MRNRQLFSFNCELHKMLSKHMMRILFIISIMLLSVSTSIVAQDININNLESINVDELSDQQISKFADEVEKRGLTEQQLELLARSKGMSPLQIAKLKQRIMILQTKASGEEITSSDRLRADLATPPNDVGTSDIFGSLADQEKESELMNIYGMDFFTNPNLTFTPSLNIPTPKNYLLAAGDEIYIDVWGSSEQSYQLTISPEGKIIIQGLGPIYLVGLSVEEATLRIKSKLKRIYAGLGNDTFVDVSLGQIRSISVSIVGEVQRPGTYTTSSFSSVLNALYFAGGPNENGSLRKIDIVRNGKIYESVDIYNLLSGDNFANVLLNDQDIIIVRPYVGRITIEGEVKRSGIYEINKDETFEDILNLSGGFTDNAYRSNITVIRNEGLTKKVRTITQNEFDLFKVQGGDRIYVSEIINKFENRVQISGAVMKPGEYELTDGLTLYQLIEKAEGIQGDAFRGRGLIVRLNDDYTLSNMHFNLDDVLNGKTDIKLKNEDFIKVQSKLDLREKYSISIQGEINSPGRYPFIDSMNVEDIIFLANGFKESAAKSFVEVARRVQSDSEANKNSSEIFNFKINSDLTLADDASQFKLQPFDLIVIRESPNYNEQKIVIVEGEVKYPGKYSLEKKDERISDILKRSGGVTLYGYPKGATLIRRTEYYVDEEEDIEAAKQRRESLEMLSSRDSLLSREQFEIKQQESIGIELNKILENPGSKYDLLLKEGDIISIPMQLQTVRMRGELLYPSTVRFDKTRSFRDYISQAGGFSNDARKGKSYVVYANGSAKQTKNLLLFKDYPKVEPGAEIIIPRKPLRQPLSAQAWIALASSAATLAIAIQQLVP